MHGALPAAAAARPGRRLPAWPVVLAVVAHPDDESFGLGALLDMLAAGGAAVHVLCYTHGEASTVNETRADLRRAREAELRQAAAELGVASVTLLDYPDGRLAEIRPAELAAHAAAAAARRGAGRAGRRAARAGLGAARRRGRPAQGRDRPGLRRPAGRDDGPVRPGQQEPATARRRAARQPGLPRRGTVAAAAAAGRVRAPALARPGGGGRRAAGVRRPRCRRGLRPGAPRGPGCRSRCARRRASAPAAAPAPPGG